MRLEAVIFDLGNTLVRYYSHDEWPGVLAECLGNVADYLRDHGLLTVDSEELPARAEAERGQSPDHAVRPLDGRLIRIFELGNTRLNAEAMPEMARRFLAPIFARSKRYDDALPTLDELHARGFRTGILSNTPWGTPAIPWREEVNRHGLLTAVDAVAFCVECGYRKPAPQPFRHIAAKLGVAPEACFFVGDDPRWDPVGARGAGMHAILIDRTGAVQAAKEPLIHELSELFKYL